MFCVGIDGIKNEIDFGVFLDVDIYELSSEELSKIFFIFGFLEGVLEVLEKDYEFLIVGGVFMEDLIEIWIDYKMENEVKFMCL